METEIKRPVLLRKKKRSLTQAALTCIQARSWLLCDNILIEVDKCI